jgi:hypothetical protein
MPLNFKKTLNGSVNQSKSADALPEKHNEEENTKAKTSPVKPIGPRKAKPEAERNTVQFGFYMTSALSKQLSEYCDSIGAQRVEIGRRALKAYLDEKMKK